jgi:hypothetical protein
MIACTMSVRIRELATLWNILLEMCEDHENMWCGATRKNTAWNRGVGVNLTYTWPEQSGKLDGIWDEITTGFLNFLYQWIEKKPSMDRVAIRCELWRNTIMIWRQINKKDKCWVYKNQQERITTDEEIEKTPQLTLMRKKYKFLKLSLWESFVEI